jgi:hypothetical protein
MARPAIRGSPTAFAGGCLPNARVAQRGGRRSPDAWLRLSRADRSEVENLSGWLTTVVARVALNMLRARNTRRERPLDVYVPDPIIDPADGRAETIASRALLWSRVDITMRRALINGAAGVVTFLHGRPFSIAALTVKEGRIVEIDFLADPADRPTRPRKARRLARP